MCGGSAAKILQEYSHISVIGDGPKIGVYPTL